MKNKHSGELKQRWQEADDTLLLFCGHWSKEKLKESLWISPCPDPGLHKYNFSHMSADTRQRLALSAADKWRQNEWPVQLEITNHHYIYEYKSIFLTFEITNFITVNSSLKTAFSLYMLHYLIFILPNYMLLIKYERSDPSLNQN